MSNVSIFLAGDFCSKPSTSFIHVSDELRGLIEKCDVKVVNFEVPLRPETVMEVQERERFYQNDDAPSFLKGLGFDLFSLANNHAFDCGEEGFLKTRSALGDGVFGAGTYEEAYRVKVVEVNGLKIGFLAVSFAAYRGVFDDVTDKEGTACAYINDLHVNHVIIDARREVDYLFVLPHDGIEYIDAPMPETIARYRDFIDYGADAVIASHPHCPQGWEIYGGKPIFYSLGNFFFNSKEDTFFRADKPHWYEGRCVILKVGDECISWDVINTRNIENVSLDVDHSDKSRIHNERICHLLQDRTEYMDYLKPLIRRQAKRDLSKMQGTFAATSVIQSLKQIFHKPKKKTSPAELANLLRHDQKLKGLIRTLKETGIV